MWICPKCNRRFKNTNQDHSCGNFSIEMVFEKYPSFIYDVFKYIHDHVRSYGEMQIRAVKNGVMFSVKTTFLALKPHAHYLGIEFSLGNEYNEFPIERCVKISKKEYAHIMRIENKQEIDQQLFNWLKEAYEFNLTKK